MNEMKCSLTVTNKQEIEKNDYIVQTSYTYIRLQSGFAAKFFVCLNVSQNYMIDYNIVLFTFCVKLMNSDVVDSYSELILY